MLDQQKINELERAYHLAAYQALGARRAAGVLMPGSEARNLVMAEQRQLEGEAALAMAAWKAYVGCTPKVEADFAAKYGVQQHSLSRLAR